MTSALSWLAAHVITLLAACGALSILAAILFSAFFRGITKDS